MIRIPRLPRRRLFLCLGLAGASLGLAAPAAIAGAPTPPPVGTSGLPIPGTVRPSSSEEPPICVIDRVNQRDICFSTEPYWDLLADIVRSI